MLLLRPVLTSPTLALIGAAHRLAWLPIFTPPEVWFPFLFSLPPVLTFPTAHNRINVVGISPSKHTTQLHWRKFWRFLVQSKGRLTSPKIRLRSTLDNTSSEEYFWFKKLPDNPSLMTFPHWLLILANDTLSLRWLLGCCKSEQAWLHISVPINLI